MEETKKVGCSMRELEEVIDRTWKEEKAKLFPNGCPDVLKDIWRLGFKEGIIFHQSKWRYLK